MRFESQELRLRFDALTRTPPPATHSSPIRAIETNAYLLLVQSTDPPAIRRGLSGVGGGSRILTFEHRGEDLIDWEAVAGGRASLEYRSDRIAPSQKQSMIVLKAQIMRLYL